MQRQLEKDEMRLVVQTRRFENHPPAVDHEMIFGEELEKSIVLIIFMSMEAEIWESTTGMQRVTRI